MTHEILNFYIKFNSHIQIKNSPKRSYVNSSMGANHRVCILLVGFYSYYRPMCTTLCTFKEKILFPKLIFLRPYISKGQKSHISCQLHKSSIWCQFLSTPKKSLKYNLHNALTKVYGVTHNQTEDPSLHSSHNHYASVLSFQIMQSKGPVIRISLVQAEVHVKVSQGKPWSMGEHRGHITAQTMRKNRVATGSLWFQQNSSDKWEAWIICKFLSIQSCSWQDITECFEGSIPCILHWGHTLV